MENLRKIISKVFEEQFRTAKLEDVIIEPDVDHDGDDILRIKFVFELEEGQLDAQKVKSLIRHLREPLEEIHEARFPVINFITKDEFTGEAA